eukprot:GHVR01004980.1.p1 GENE.GHVR01004980.1~~GHVR01004980.1.p1  ORF type:complete len:260 (+),score=69.77 GHVR01004980.1:49-780(+)
MAKRGESVKAGGINGAMWGLLFTSLYNIGISFIFLILLFFFCIITYILKLIGLTNISDYMSYISSRVVGIESNFENFIGQVIHFFGLTDCLSKYINAAKKSDQLRHIHKKKKKKNLNEGERKLCESQVTGDSNENINENINKTKLNEEENPNDQGGEAAIKINRKHSHDNNHTITKDNTKDNTKEYGYNKLNYTTHNTDIIKDKEVSYDNKCLSSISIPSSVPIIDDPPPCSASMSAPLNYKR